MGQENSIKTHSKRARMGEKDTAEEQKTPLGKRIRRGTRKNPPTEKTILLTVDLDCVLSETAT